MRRRNTEPKPADRQLRMPRRGSLYIGVMLISLIVSLIGLSAAHIAVISLQQAEMSNDEIKAQLLSRAAVENGINCLNKVGTWRTNYTSGVEIAGGTSECYGTGTFSWVLTDADGNLADDDADAAWLTGIGRCGEAVYAQTVLIQPTGQPISALEASFQCQGDIIPTALADISTTEFVSTNSNIDASAYLSSITGDAEAVGTITGNVTGSSVSAITPRRMPSDTAFDYYRMNGSVIKASTLPQNAFGQPVLERFVLSPNLNPFGSETNPEGIYVLDCEGLNPTIQNGRIFGTLVVINAGTSVSLAGAIHSEPAVLNYPTLLVEGSAQFWCHNLPLDEAALAMSFNPPGAPYLGVSDTDTTDTYPSRFKGIVYVSATASFPADGLNTSFVGTFIAGSATLSSDISLDYRSTYLDYPPPGFAHGNPMRIAPKTWRRTASP